MLDPCSSSNSPYGNPYGVGGTSSAAPVWSPIASGATEDETQSAIDDSADEGVITSLSGAPDPQPTYNAEGLLNSFVQAGTPVASPDVTDSGVAPGVESEDGAVLGAETANGTNPDPGAAAEGYPNVWGSTLQSNPWMASTVVGDAGDQGLVSSLSDFA